MRVLILTIVLLSAGCATGVRVGGDRYGAGVGGYVGPVPHHVQESYLMPPVVPER